MPTAPCIGDHSTEKDIEDPSDVVMPPATSTTPKIGQRRCKVLRAHLRPISHALVARLVGREEMESNPDAQKSIDVEWNNLERKGEWDYNTVVKDVKSRGEKVHVGNLA